MSLSIPVTVALKVQPAMLAVSKTRWPTAEVARYFLPGTSDCDFTSHFLTSEVLKSLLSKILGYKSEVQATDFICSMWVLRQLWVDTSAPIHRYFIEFKYKKIFSKSHLCFIYSKILARSPVSSRNLRVMLLSSSGQVNTKVCHM